mgnify:CR=1 FL=1
MTPTVRADGINSMTVTATDPPPSATPLPPQRQAWLRLRRDKIAVASAVFLAVVALACIAGPWLSPHDFRGGAPGPESPLSAPSWRHWAGTDLLGRDLLVRTLHGGRISLMVGALGTLVSLVVGVSAGLAAGYLGGRVDAALMRLAEIVQALPFTVMVILLMVTFGQDIRLIFLAIGLVEWPTMARVVRGQALSVRQRPYVSAAHALGQRDVATILRHLLPNVSGIIIVYATLTAPSVILLEAFLSFLGLGVQAPQTSWGQLIGDGVKTMDAAPWLLIAPSIAFAGTLLSLNLLGDRLRDRLDPR